MSRWHWQQDAIPMAETELEPIQTIAVADHEAARDDADLDLVLAIHQKLIVQIDPKRLAPLPPAEARAAVSNASKRILSEIAPQVVGESRDQVVEAVCDEVLGLGPIEKLVKDASISEVMVNAPDRIYWERKGVIHESPVRFRDEEHIMRIVQRIVAPLGRRVDESSPYVDARLPDGSRVNIVIPPIAYKSPVITIRKFHGGAFGMKELVEVGSLSQQVSEFLEAAVNARLNILISGGTGSGKTTLLNALSAAIPERERIVTIEDPAELRLQQKHVISLEVRPPNIEGRNEVTQRDLVKNSLRMRPDRILLGEVRGAEAFDMMQAMNTGHEGSLTTVHANTPRDALARIENMIMMAGFDLPVRAIREQLSSALHLMIQISRISDGSRKVVSVTEVTGMENQTITLQDLFTFKREGTDAEGRVLGQLVASGIRPHHHDRFEAAGVELPIAMFARMRP